MPHFNDSRREWELNELCEACGHRNGVHSMYNKCPVQTNSGKVIPREFTDNNFVHSGEFQQHAA
jgi:hypothetical protein